MSILDIFRSDDSLATELSQHEVDIWHKEGHAPENVDLTEYEGCTKMYIQSSMTRNEVINRLDETRRIVRY